MTTDNSTILAADQAAKVRRDDLEAWLESRVARNTSDADSRLPKRLTARQAG